MQIEEYRKMDELQKHNWWYRGRRFVVEQLFVKYFNGGLEKTFLDLGCGTGEGINVLKDYGSVVGLDASEEALLIAQAKGYDSLRLGSAEKLFFGPDSFDAVLMLDVLEHTDNDAEVLKESFRVLKDNGLFVLTVPAYQWLWSGHDEVFGHRRRYTRKDLVSKVKKAGFEIRFSSYYVSFVFPVIAAFRVIERVVRNKKTSHFFKTPRIINWGLYAISFFEGVLLRFGVRFPFGGSVVLLARKKI